MKHQFLSIFRRVFFIAKAEPFGSMVRRQPEDLSHTYPITYSIGSAYLPTEKNKYTIYNSRIEIAQNPFSPDKRTSRSGPIAFNFVKLYNQITKIKEETKMTFLILLFLFYAVLCILGKF